VNEIEQKCKLWNLHKRSKDTNRVESHIKWIKKVKKDSIKKKAKKELGHRHHIVQGLVQFFGNISEIHLFVH